MLLKLFFAITSVALAIAASTNVNNFAHVDVISGVSDVNCVVAVVISAVADAADVISAVADAADVISAAGHVIFAG